MKKNQEKGMVGVCALGRFHDFSRLAGVRTPIEAEGKDSQPTQTVEFPKQRM
jgi:hypothetical protein